MFSDPSANQSLVEPGRYCAKVVKLEKMPPSPEHPDWSASIRWYLNLATYPELRVLYDDQGQPLELWVYCSESLHAKSKGRPWVEAFLGRPLVDGQDKGAAIGTALIGQKAVCMIGPNRTGRTDILQAEPYREPAKNGAAQRSAAVATLEDDLPVEQRSPVAEEELAF